MSKRQRTGDDGSSFKARSGARPPFDRSMAAFGKARFFNPPKAYGYRFIKSSAAGQAKYGSSYASANAAQQLSRKADRYYGRGAYSVGPKNSLFIDRKDTYSSEPSFRSRNDETGALTIRHREYLKDIYGNSLVGGVPLNFVVSEIAINPGIEASFPWLSQVAQNFEEYSIKQLVYSYKSTLSDVNSANGQVGSVVTATNYNPSLPAFKDKASMMQYAHAHTTVATMNNVHGVEAHPKKLSGPEGKFIRVNTMLDNEDIKTYDHGKFQIAVCGTPTALADLPIGELWVEYTIELRKPKLFTGIGSAISTFTVRNNYVPDTGTLTGVHPLGDLSSGSVYPVINKNSTLPCTLTKSSSADGTTIQFPDYFSGYVKLEIRIAFTAALNNQYRIRAPGLLGNVLPAYDMTVSPEYHETGFPSTGTYGFVHNPPKVGTSAGERAGITLIAHYHVGLPSHGVKNQLVWGTDTGPWLTGDCMLFQTAQATLEDWNDSWNGTALSPGDVDGCELTIAEYNSPLDTTNSITWAKASDGSNSTIG